MAGKDRHVEAFTLTAVSGQARPSRKLAAAPALLRVAHVWADSAVVLRTARYDHSARTSGCEADEHCQLPRCDGM